MVQHVLLQHAEERLRSRIVTSCPNPAHRTNQPLTLESLGEFPGSELAATVAVNCDPTRMASVRHCHFHGVDSQLGVNPRIH